MSKDPSDQQRFLTPGSFLRSRTVSLSSRGSWYRTGSCFTGPEDILPARRSRRVGDVRDPGGGPEAPLNRRLGSVLTALLLGGVRPHPPSQVGPVLTVLLRVHAHVAPLPGQEQRLGRGSVVVMQCGPVGGEVEWICSVDVMRTSLRRG